MSCRSRRRDCNCAPASSFKNTAAATCTKAPSRYPPTYTSTGICGDGTGDTDPPVLSARPQAAVCLASAGAAELAAASPSGTTTNSGAASIELLAAAPPSGPPLSAPSVTSPPVGAITPDAASAAAAIAAASRASRRARRMPRWRSLTVALLHCGHRLTRLSHARTHVEW